MNETEPREVATETSRVRSRGSTQDKDSGRRGDPEEILRPGENPTHPFGVFGRLGDLEGVASLKELAQAGEENHFPGCPLDGLEARFKHGQGSVSGRLLAEVDRGVVDGFINADFFSEGVEGGIGGDEVAGLDQSADVFALAFEHGSRFDLEGIKGGLETLRLDLDGRHHGRFCL